MTLEEMKQQVSEIAKTFYKGKPLASDAIGDLLVYINTLEYQSVRAERVFNQQVDAIRDLTETLHHVAVNIPLWETSENNPPGENRDLVKEFHRIGVAARAALERAKGEGTC